MKRSYTGHPLIGVGAVVLINNSVLLIKRANEPCKGCWAIPGGLLDYGESIVDAVRRELYEETGLVGKPTGIIWVDNIIVKDEYNKVKYHYVIIDLLFTDIKGRVKPGSDALEARWFKINNIPKEITPSTRKLLDHIARAKDITVIPVPSNYECMLELLSRA